jgi:hypothetical protein
MVIAAKVCSTARTAKEWALLACGGVRRSFNDSV